MALPGQACLHVTEKDGAGLGVQLTQAPYRCRHSDGIWNSNQNLNPCILYTHNYENNQRIAKCQLSLNSIVFKPVFAKKIWHYHHHLRTIIDIEFNKQTRPWVIFLLYLSVVVSVLAECTLLLLSQFEYMIIASKDTKK